jgi:ABC-type nitrate/sulfonate/bicarbonate transport system, ATPase component
LELQAVEKTTLLNALTGINKIESGEKFSLENKKFSYVFQEDRLLPWATALENVLFVLRDRYCDEEAKTNCRKISKYSWIREIY